MDDFKKELIEIALNSSEGFEDDPHENGYETKFGLNKNTCHKFGYIESIEKLNKKEAFKIYEKKYWVGLHLDEIEKLDKDLAKLLFNTSVKLGLLTCISFLKTALNVLNYKNEKTGLFKDLKEQDFEFNNEALNALKEFIKHKKNKGLIVLKRIINSLKCIEFMKDVIYDYKKRKFLFDWILNQVDFKED